MPMDKRAWTVGSLIPGKMNPYKAPSPVPSSQPDQKPDKITFLQNEQRFEITPAKGTLLDVALNQGNDLQYKCRKGTCGLCTVKILDDSGRLSPANEQEQRKLINSLNSGYRLSCQAEIM